MISKVFNSHSFVEKTLANPDGLLRILNIKEPPAFDIMTKPDVVNCANPQSKLLFKIFLTKDFVCGRYTENMMNRF